MNNNFLPYQLKKTNEDYNNLSTQLAENSSDLMTRGISAKYPPSSLTALVYSGDEGSKLNSILTYAQQNKINKVYITGNVSTSVTINIPTGVRLIGIGYQNTSITGTTANMIVVQMNSCVDSGIEDITIAGDSGFTMTGIYIQNNSSRFTLKNVMLTSLKIGLNIYYSWSGHVEKVHTSGVTTGIVLGAQTNQVDFISCNIKSNGGILSATSASTLKFITCQLTQFGNPNVYPFTFTGQFQNVLFDTCYLEGLSTTATFMSVSASVGVVSNISFDNCTVIGTIPKLIYASSTNYSISNIRFTNNAMVVTTLFDYLLNAHTFVFENNTFDNLLSPATNDNFAINGDLVSWSGNTPNGVTTAFSSVLTKGTSVDDGSNYLDVVKGSSTAQVVWSFKSFYANYISIEFEALSPSDTTISFKLNDNSALSVPVTLTTTFQKCRYFLYIGSSTLINKVRLISNNEFQIRKLKISNGVNIDKVRLDNKYLTSAPTDGSHNIGQQYKNATPTLLGTAGSKYVIDKWVSLTDGTSNVLNTDWVESHVLTGA